MQDAHDTKLLLVDLTSNFFVLWTNILVYIIIHRAGYFVLPRNFIGGEKCPMYSKQKTNDEEIEKPMEIELDNVPVNSNKVGHLEI